NELDAVTAAAVVAEIEAGGGTARPYAVSVTDYDSSTEMVADVVRRFGRIDILVSNAGVASSGASVLRTPVEEADAMMRLLAMAALVLCQAALPSMREHRRGDI